MGHHHDSDHDKLSVVLPHLAKHSKDHIEDAEKWLKMAEDAGIDAVVPDLEKVVQLYREIDRCLESAVSAIKGK
jgi:ferritin